MNFFEHQDEAKRVTGRLYFYMICAVLGIIISVYVLIAGLLLYSASQSEGQSFSFSTLMNPALFLLISGGTITVVLLGSLYKTSQLSGGGKVVAESMGGRLLNHDTSDLVEKRLLNVVDEMAIASGAPSPPVYLMDHEWGINAFAAGNKISHSVIGVTRGTAETLSRDELQGVIAHQFSHILNGDVKISLRLVGIVHGIMIIGIIGYYLLRATAYSRSRERNNMLPLIGLGLMAIGFIGTFFGNLIKASVSRQREFLADASAVQFTRNPDGISGALKRIGGYQQKGQVDNPHATEISHMFFVTGLSGSFASLFATHPPLEERINRIDPNWRKQQGWNTTPHGEFEQSGQTAGFAGQSSAVDTTQLDQGPVKVGEDFRESVVQSIGSVNAEQVSYAHQLLQRVPEPIIRASHDAYGARALILALLVYQDDADDQEQMAMLHQKLDANLFSLVSRLLPIMPQLIEADRLPVIDIALPHLGAMSPTQAKAFVKNVRSIIASDRKVDLFEWSLSRILEHHLDISILPTPAQQAKLSTETEMVSFLISWLAHMGHTDESKAREAHTIAMTHWGDNKATFHDLNDCTLPAISHTLAQMADFNMQAMKKIMTTSLACITADGFVDIREYEIIRSIAATLEIPMPPLQPSLIAVAKI